MSVYRTIGPLVSDISSVSLKTMDREKIPFELHRSLCSYTLFLFLYGFYMNKVVFKPFMDMLCHLI